jgi:monoamine oxidase
VKTIIYPSYGDVRAGKTTTLIAGYCLSDDSHEFAAMVEKDKDNTEITNVVLKDLADIHNVTVEFLRSELIDTFAWSLSSDPYAMGKCFFRLSSLADSWYEGAFAAFGPGKYQSLYTSLTSPAADGLLHFAGEALSIRHGTVEGALHGAWRAVNEMLSLIPDGDKYLANFHEKWGRNPEWVLEQ